MKEMTLHEIQTESLKIIKDVHQFCESHHINYSLAYGTLLGAIRHKGFIPWDDDIDIVLPRPDFERFCREYQSMHDYTLYTPEDGKSYLTFARVCDNKYTDVKTVNPWCNEATGIWIDIFPLDGVPKDIFDFQRHVKKIKDIATIVYRVRLGKYSKLSNTKGVKDFVYCLIKKILYSNTDINALVKKHIDLLKTYAFENSDYYGQLCVMDYPEKEHNPKCDFENCLKVSFADSEFYIMNGYDSFLKRYYGNYMELPPEGNRVPPQSEYKFYWK